MTAPLVLAGHEVPTVLVSSRFSCAVCRGWAEVANTQSGMTERCPHCALGVPIAYPPLLTDRLRTADQEIS